MGIYRRKDSPYYWFKFSVNGRLHQGTTETENRKLAERIMSKRRDEIVEGKHFDVTQEKKATTFDEFCINKYIPDYAKIHKASWKSDDLNCIKSFRPFFGSTTLDNLTAQDINRYVIEKSKTLKKSTVNHYLRILRSILNMAIEWGYLNNNPALKVKYFKKVDNRRKRVLKKEELEKFMACADKEMQLITLFALMSFLRKKDLRAVSQAKVDFETKYIHAYQSKTHKDIDMPMNDTLEYVMRNLNIPLKHDFRSKFKTAKTKSGIQDFQFRDLRRTGATYLHGLGVDLYTIAVLLGHKAPDALTMIKDNLQMTARYTQVSNDLLYNAVKKLDGYCGLSSGMKWTAGYSAVTQTLRCESQPEIDIDSLDITPLESAI